MFELFLEREAEREFTQGAVHTINRGAEDGVGQKRFVADKEAGEPAAEGEAEDADARTALRVEPADERAAIGDALARGIEDGAYVIADEIADGSGFARFAAAMVGQ